jgi:hypothetical protein
LTVLDTDDHRRPKFNFDLGKTAQVVDLADELPGGDVVGENWILNSKCGLQPAL